MYKWKALPFRKFKTLTGFLVFALFSNQASAEAINAKAILQLNESAPCILGEATPYISPITDSDRAFAKDLEENPNDYQLAIRDGGMVTSLFGNTKHLPLFDINSIEYIGTNDQGWKRYKITPKVGKPIYDSLNFMFFETCKKSSLGEGQRPQCEEIVSLRGTCTDGRDVQLVLNQMGKVGQPKVKWAYLMKMTFLSAAEVDAAGRQHVQEEQRAEAERQVQLRKELSDARATTPAKSISAQVPTGVAMTPRAMIQQQMDAFKARVLEAKEASLPREASIYIKSIKEQAQQGFFRMCMKYGMPTGSVELVAYINKGGAATYIDAYPKTKLADCPIEMLNAVQFLRPPASLFEEPGFPVHLQFNVAGN